MIIGIVAVDHQWAIGKKNGLLFKLPADMKHFKELTTGHIVCCGWNTLMSFPHQIPLPNRVTICIAPEGTDRKDCLIVHTIDELVKVIKENEPADCFIIGGGMLYKSMLPYYDKVIVTKVDAEDKEATVFFPNLDKEKDFKIVEESKIIKDNNYNIKFVTYERIK